MVRMSAAILGREIGGLTAAEVNMLLHERGYLDGEPCAWGVTGKGAPYATESYHHCGVGGYDMYNPEWTTRTWDESILDEIGDVSSEQRRELAEKVALHRIQARERNLEPVIPEMADDMDGDVSDEGFDYAAAGRIMLGFAVAAGLGYAAYKAAPYVKAWWVDAAHPALRNARQRFKSRFEGDDGRNGEDGSDSTGDADAE